MKKCRNTCLSRTCCFQAALCLSFLGALCLSAVAHAKSFDSERLFDLHESYFLSMKIHELEYRLASYGAQIIYAKDDKKISNKEKLEILFDALALIQQKNHEEHLFAQQTSIRSFVHEGEEEYLIACEDMGGGVGGLGIRGPALPCFGGPGLEPSTPAWDRTPDSKDFEHGLNGVKKSRIDMIPRDPSSSEGNSSVTTAIGAAALHIAGKNPIVSGIMVAVGSTFIIAVGDWATDHVSDSYHIANVEYFVKAAVKVSQNKNLSSRDKRETIRELQGLAHEHNKKIKRRTKSSSEAIENLNVHGLRY